MRLRPIGAHRLADFIKCQLADHRRADGQANRQRRQHTEDRAQRQILKNIESAKGRYQQLGQVIKHRYAPSVSAPTTRSMCALREPLTNTVTPRASIGIKFAINSS